MLFNARELCLDQNRELTCDICQSKKIILGRGIFFEVRIVLRYFVETLHCPMTLYVTFQTKGPLIKDVRMTPGEGGSAESGYSIFIRVRFY